VTPIKEKVYQSSFLGGRSATIGQTMRSDNVIDGGRIEAFGYTFWSAPNDPWREGGGECMPGGGGWAIEEGGNVGFNGLDGCEGEDDTGGLLAPGMYDENQPILIC
jgi:hypothetical protein